MTIVTRYAPSPTGQLHLGGLRTALFNYLFAKKHGGSFLLRIEDTDAKRTVPGAEAALIKSLRAFGLNPDGNIERQSDRLPIYKEHIKILKDCGHVYPCFCTEDRLAALKQQNRLSGANIAGYDGKCRGLSDGEVAKRLENGESHVWRMRVPREGSTVLEDLVHGRMVFENSTVDDQVVLKSDGFPTYHLASVVDDHLMHISHVIRGEEWLSSTPKHVMLYNSFKWDPPQFAHLPLLLNKDHSKLSKRRGDGDVNFFLEQGYLPMAVLNFVALLGWSPRLSSDNDEDSVDEEKIESIYTSLEDMTQAFQLEHATKKGVVVDTDFLYWMGGQHMRRLDNALLIQRLKEQDTRAVHFDESYLQNVVELIKTRLFRDGDIMYYANPFLCDQLERSDEDLGVLNEKTENWPQALPLVVKALQGVEDWDSKENLAKSLKQAVKTLASSGYPSLTYKNLMLVLRYVIMGTLKGAELVPSLQVLGKEKVIQRLDSYAS